MNSSDVTAVSQHKIDVVTVSIVPYYKYSMYRIFSWSKLQRAGKRKTVITSGGD